MKKTLTSVLLSLILTLTASGCAPELYERLLISAIGVDRTATGCRVMLHCCFLMAFVPTSGTVLKRY